MVEGKFDIVFAGRTVPSKSMDEVKQNLARLFKTQPAQIERLFSGQEVTIKKALDYAQAMKYQSALKQAGALALLRKQESHTAESVAKTSNQQPATNPASTDTASANSASPVSSTPSEHTTASATPVETASVSQAEAADDGDWSVAAAGEVLPAIERAEAIPEPDLSGLNIAEVGATLGEKRQQEAVEIDTSDLTLGELGRLSPEREYAQKEVDVSSLSMAEAGEKIPQQKVEKELVDPNTEHLSLNDK